VCRVLAYLGEQLPLSALIYDSDCSLAHQVYEPFQYRYLNIGGTGVAAWDRDSPDPGRPLMYRTTGLPMYDRNLLSLTRKTKADCLLGHVRGTDYFEAGVQLVAEPNVHPFQFVGAPIALAHNGGLHSFRRMKHALLAHIDPVIASQIEGTTDSEWIYAVVLTELMKLGEPVTADTIGTAVSEALRAIRRVREEHDIAITSAVNLFVSDGSNLVVTRFVYDFGRYEGIAHRDQITYHSLWYTVGSDFGLHDGEWRMQFSPEPSCVLVASEPLTENESAWVEVPEYTMILASRENGRIKIDARDLDV
jgi:glutamine amidotransferase